MKVAHLTTVDLSLRYLVFPQLKATRDLGWDTSGISSDGPWVNEIESEGIRHLRLASSTRGMNIIADLRAALELWKILQEEQFDILHTHNPKPGLYGRVLGRMAGVPVVVNTVHGLYATQTDRFLKRGIVYMLEAFASRFSDAELVQSDEDVSTMKRLRLAPRKHIWHLGNGVDLSRFSPGVLAGAARDAIRDEFGASKTDIVVGVVGRLVAEKGYPELFEAAARLDRHYVVVCIGPDDRDKADALPASMIDAAKADGVVFLGMRTDMEKLYQAMDIFVLPSHREGFPRSAMEAAASGVPVIATDIRGCRDVVDDGVNGFLIPVFDPQAIASEITKLGVEPAMRSRMGAAGRARAEGRFDESRVVRRVLSVYRRLARSKGLEFHDHVDASHVKIRPATPTDIDAIARLHSAGINTGFLPILGQRFMRRLYGALIGATDGIVIVADDGSGAVGFVAGVVDTRQFYRNFIRRHGLAAGIVALPRAFRPHVMKRVWESLNYEGGQTGGAELLATALLPAARDQGLGTRLGNDFLRQIAEKGAHTVDVVVSEENHRAIAAYRKMGFTDSDTIEVHEGERSVVLQWSA